MKTELMKGDSLEVSAHIPMYNPHILPLKEFCNFTICYNLQLNEYFPTKGGVHSFLNKLTGLKIIPERDVPVAVRLIS